MDNAVRAKKTFTVFFFFTLFCAAFGFIYEIFSHNVYSPFMMFGFAIPLVTVVLPMFIIYLADGKGMSGAIGASFYNCGVVTLTVGCLFKGVLDIYGTTNHLMIVYAVAGVTLTVIGVALWLYGALRSK